MKPDVQAIEAWRSAVLPPTASLADAVKNLNETAIKIVLCAGDDGTLIGTVTDGDVRRGLIRGLNMDAKLADVVNESPLVLPESTSKNAVHEIMKANKLLQVPVVDSHFRLVGLHLWDELDASDSHNHVMVIMAGGKGTRLKPLTDNCPKPMLPVAGQPMLQHIIARAKSQGFTSFVLSLNHMGQMIRDHFLAGEEFGVSISYVEESEPLGTAGALSLLEPRPETAFVVTNGDVLTDIDYLELIQFQRSHNADAVMAVRQYEWVNPYGVVEMQGGEITGFTEKPVTRSHINAGVYALSPEVLNFLTRDQHCDMPSLFTSLRHSGLRTVGYPMHEPWLDVGRPADLAMANKNFS